MAKQPLTMLESKVYIIRSKIDLRLSSHFKSYRFMVVWDSFDRTLHQLTPLNPLTWIATTSPHSWKMLIIDQPTVLRQGTSQKRFLMGKSPIWNHPTGCGCFQKYGKTPQIIPCLIGFSIINHPFWGFSPYFWKHPCRTPMFLVAWKSHRPQMTFAWICWL